jgi:uncharacterized protein YlaI
MTLRQQIQTIVSNRSGAFRTKALVCEQRARESTDPASKQDWEELAIEWHTMAHLPVRTARSLQLQSSNMPVSFGIADTRVCPECKNRMHLTRRKPHPMLGNAFELQTFTCSTCEHEIERGVDRLGEAVPVKGLSAIVGGTTGKR